ncbi:MAG: hypothetical protein JWN64_597 [Parcubacteria group bacterium]|nr:hypothetical protein [Parcubacteria group bacterium]
MKRHLATRESIAKLQEARKKRVSQALAKKGNENGLSKAQVHQAVMSISKSGYRVPAKLVPKVPS